jgi:branched-chain amino acid transport system substrate-binding protein
VVTLVSDYGPGIDAEKFFKERFSFNGGQVLDALRVPLRTPTSRPCCRRCATPSPTRCSSSCPRAGAAVMKQFLERGMDKAGIRLIATGDVTDDDQLNDMGDGALGVVTAHHYSADHNSVNKKFVEAFQKANPNMRPTSWLGGYDGMRVIYEASRPPRARATARRCWAP